MLRLLNTCAFAGFLVACGTPADDGQACVTSNDCQDLCNNLHECDRSENVREVLVRWTVGGIAPTPVSDAACGAIAAFEVGFDSPFARDEPVRYFPVPCDLGQVRYTAMPVDYDILTLTATNESGEFVDEQSLRLNDEAEVEVEFSF